MSEFPLVTIITPTVDRPWPTLHRAIGSVEGQTYSNWQHIVCSDGPENPSLRERIVDASGYCDTRREYRFTGVRLGHFGAGARQEMHQFCRGDLWVYLDDDNVLLPDYLERMVAALQAKPTAGFVIGKIIHFGRLRPGLGPILEGQPRVQEIDTLQVLVKRSAMAAIGGWQFKEYTSDGYTYQKLGEQFEYARVSEVVGVHY